MLQKNLLNQLNPKLIILVLLYLKLFSYQRNNFYFNFFSINLYINLVYLIKNKKLTKYTMSKTKKRRRYVYRVKYTLLSLNKDILNILATGAFFKKNKQNKTPLRFFVKKHLFLKFFIKRRRVIKYLSKNKCFSWFKYKIIKKPYKAFTLKQRQFIVKKVLVKRLFKFLVKHNPYVTSFLKYKFFKRRRVFLMNMHKKLAWKMHKARIIHWNFSTKGQLNKYRYNKLLANCLYFLKKNSAVTGLIYLLFCVYNYSSTWKQLILIISKNLIVYNGKFIYENITLKQGDIIELPFGKCFFTKIKNKNYNNEIKKLKRITYKFFKNKKKKNKKIPKIYKKVLFKAKIRRDFIAYDPTLNIIAIIDKVPTFNYNLKYELLKSSVVGLQNWRYEFQ